MCKVVKNINFVVSYAWDENERTQSELFSTYKLNCFIPSTSV